MCGLYEKECIETSLKFLTHCKQPLINIRFNIDILFNQYTIIKIMLKVNFYTALIMHRRDNALHLSPHHVSFLIQLEAIFPEIRLKPKQVGKKCWNSVSVSVEKGYIGMQTTFKSQFIWVHINAIVSCFYISGVLLRVVFIFC